MTQVQGGSLKATKEYMPTRKAMCRTLSLTTDQSVLRVTVRLAETNAEKRRAMRGGNLIWWDSWAYEVIDRYEEQP